jgi:hypothetical protein
MKPVIACLALLLSASPLRTEEEKEVVAPARLLMTGKAEALVQVSGVKVTIQAGEDVKKKLADALKSITATMFNLDDQTRILIVLPKDSFTVNDALKVLGKPMAVEGILTDSDDAGLIALSGAKGAKRVPLLIAERVTLVNEKNRDGFPAENQATVEGVAIKGQFKVGKGALEWAIRNADGHIPIALPGEVKPPADGAKTRASGKLRMVDGLLVLDAVKVEPMKK